MRSKLIYVVSLLMCAASAVGCATMPSVQDSRPWQRIISSQEAIKPGAKIKVEVSGAASPLLGKEDLAFGQVRSILTRLLIRRGFVPEVGDYDYLVRLNYKTERSDKLRASTYYSAAQYDFNSFSNSVGAASYQGLGVGLAKAVSQQSRVTVTNVGLQIDQALSYTHTVSIEVMNLTGIVIWKGDTTWDEPNLNIASNMVPALQMVVSYLPTTQAINKPEIGKIKESHVGNYYAMACANQQWFTCPALPFRIYLNQWHMCELRSQFGLGDAFALAAYIDLIQTAEYALQDGDANDWKNLLDVRLWGSVTLGGQYLMGPEKQPVNVIVKLSGANEGYYISSTKVVSDKEYAIFQQKMAGWKKAMNDYRDFYVNQ